MDSTREDQHQWSDWFSKAQPSQAEEAEERAAPSEAPGGPSSRAAQSDDPAVAGGPAVPGGPATPPADTSKVVESPSPDRAEPSGEPGSAARAGVIPTAADIRNTRPPREEQGDDGGRDGGPGPAGPLDRRVPGQTLRGHQATGGSGRRPETSGSEPSTGPGRPGGSGGPAWTPPWRLLVDESAPRRLARPPAGAWPTP
jgi:hypothetical protein